VIVWECPFSALSELRAVSGLCALSGGAESTSLGASGEAQAGLLPSAPFMLGAGKL